MASYEQWVATRFVFILSTSVHFTVLQYTILRDVDIQYCRRTYNDPTLAIERERERERDAVMMRAKTPTRLVLSFA